MKILKRLTLDEIKPGICLGIDLTDAQGRLLLAKGTVLSEKLLTMLKKQGIEQVQVEEDCAPKWADKQRDCIRASVNQRFRGINENPLMTELKSIVLAHRLEILR